ncbi:MAG: histone deacetylase family protein [Rhodobacteraceae bacterium]|nr:histone deacetylase family protein [Paracoccaceae bacterium]
MLAYISHPDCLRHDTGSLHPDTRQRLDAIQNQLIMSGLDFVLRHHDAPKATRDQLIRAHDQAYVDRVFAMAPTEGSVEIDGDTVMSPGTLDAALRSAGAGVLGVDLIMKASADPVFCGIRPPGHHAERGKAMGFCLFNNVAVAAAHALETHGLSRVAIVDFDVHHGNGTEDIFAGDPRVLFCSSFQHPFYPFTGHGSDTENLVDVPLPSGTGGDEFRAAIAEHWLPALDRFQPEFLFVSAGFDAHVLDDMSGLALSEADYAWLTTALHDIAKAHAQGRFLSMLEGGYEPGALARSVVSHLNTLLG